MKDYSKFIQSSYGFITKYEIVDDEIHVYTAETEKGEPHKYPANKEWITSVEKRLENQYKMVINNREVIKKDFLNRKSMPIKILAGLLILAFFVVGTIFTYMQAHVMPIVLGGIASILVSIFGAIVTFKISKKFDNELDLIEVYVNNRKNIEKTNEKDKNVTEYLSSKTDLRLKNNEELKKQGIIDSIFNIDFMDKTKLKDLRRLLLRYLISTELQSKQVFVNPNESEENLDKSKKRTLVQEENKII